MPTLLDGFVDAVRQYPNRVALVLGDRRWTYGELAGQAAAIGAAIDSLRCESSPMVGLLGDSSLTAYAGILGILAARCAVVPINPGDPRRRIQAVVDHSRLTALVVGREGLDRLDGLLAEAGRPLAIVAPEVASLRGLKARYPRHRFRASSDMAKGGDGLNGESVDASQPAYLVYTSGTTQGPRAVAVSHRHATAYLEAVSRRVPLRPDDRCSHTFPMTFDLSIHDLFRTWSCGATLVGYNESECMDPGRFIRHHRLTRWFSVPTVAMTMQQQGDLVPARFATLRDSLFCGEALPRSVARDWLRAAPNSSVINLYGPAEATVAVSAHRLEQRAGSRDGPAGSVVALGRVFEGQRILVVDDQDRPVGRGECGEVLIAGTQVVDGYWRDGNQTKARFVQIEGQGRQSWFRTGDRGLVDGEGCLHFRGRLDDQIKLRGHHVALSDVDEALRQVCGHAMAAAVGWPRDDHGVYGLVGMVASEEDIDDRALLAGCRRLLPPSSVPNRIVGLRRLPQTERGKLDRQAMEQLLRKREV